jgi:transcriptional regulator with XRE-family HTH domain
MDKSVHSQEYATMLELLVAKRTESGLTQVQLAKRLKLSQSAYSKLERGELRLDIVQLRSILAELDVRLSEFVSEFEKLVAPVKPTSRTRRK